MASAFIEDPIIRHAKPVDSANLVGDKVQPGHPLFGLVWINPARVSAAPCFYGSRVTVKSLFDWIAHGETVDAFLDAFEGIRS